LEAVFFRGRLNSSGTTQTSDLLKGHFRLATEAGGVFLIWRRVPGAGCNMEADFGGGFPMEAGSGADLHMEADFGGGLHIKADFGVNCIV
jgi:hypothetical protein